MLPRDISLLGRCRLSTHVSGINLPQVPGKDIVRLVRLRDWISRGNCWKLLKIGTAKMGQYPQKAPHRAIPACTPLDHKLCNPNTSGFENSKPVVETLAAVG
jgi:hypothetical protein